MDPRARERLSAAAQEFMAAEPWTRLSPRHLVGIRDRPSGRLACALVAAEGHEDRALLLGLGPGAFERFSLSWKRIARARDLPEEEKGLVFSTIGPIDLGPAGSPWAKLGSWNGRLLGACTCISPDDIRPPSTGEANFLARALRALAKWAGPGSAKAFLAPPTFPVLTVLGGEPLEIRESLESIAPPKVGPLPLLVRPEVRDAIPSVATVDAYHLHLLVPAREPGEERWRILALCDHARRKVVAAAPVPEDGLEWRGAEALLDALAGDLLCSAPPPRPARIVTDFRPLYERAREAVESLGIRLVHEPRMPSLRGFLEKVGDELEEAADRRDELRARRGRRE